MKNLLQLLSSLRPGSVTDTDALEGPLAASWHEFAGGDEQGMEGYKLRGRTWDVDWNPPVLTFGIDRHGGTVQGSSRAERHRWIVDIFARTATCEKIGFRQLRPMAARLDVRPLAEEVSKLILEHQEDDCLIWNEDRSVRVQIGKIIPANSAVQRTLEGRRRRFHKAVRDLLTRDGWQHVGRNVYRPPAQQ